MIGMTNVIISNPDNPVFKVLEEDLFVNLVVFEVKHIVAELSFIL